MRFWGFRGRPPVGAPPADAPRMTEDLLRATVEDLLVVRDRTTRGGIVGFRGDLLVTPARARDTLSERLRPFGLTPFLRRENGAVMIQAWPLADVAERSRLGLNVVLFVLTCATTLSAGLGYTGSPTFDALRSSPSAARFLAGLPFAGTLMAILLIHELGHYFTARHYRASVSLPYFIPLPIGFLGTLGAIIRMRSPGRDRNALFDIAAAGPLAGLAVAVAAMLLGLDWSSLVPVPPGPRLVFGESLLARLLTHLRFGAVPDGFVVFTHPMADAAWAGFLVTALNLFPAGQLDGGRISYALFGRWHRAIGQGTVAALVGAGVASALLSLRAGDGDLTSSINWFVWAGLITFLVGFHHSPPLDDVTPLTGGRRALGIVCLLLIVVLMPPFIIRVQ